MGLKKLLLLPVGLALSIAGCAGIGPNATYYMGTTSANYNPLLFFEQKIHNSPLNSFVLFYLKTFAKIFAVCYTHMKSNSALWRMIL